MTPAPPLPDAYLQWCAARNLQPLTEFYLSPAQTAALRRWAEAELTAADRQTLGALRVRHKRVEPPPRPDGLIGSWPRLSADQVDEIRRDTATPDAVYAERFGCTKPTIAAARKGQGAYAEIGVVSPVRAKVPPPKLNAAQVDALRKSPLPTPTLAKREGMSEDLVSAARKGLPPYHDLGSVAPLPYGHPPGFVRLVRETLHMKPVEVAALSGGFNHQTVNHLRRWLAKEPTQ